MNKIAFYKEQIYKIAAEEINKENKETKLELTIKGRGRYVQKIADMLEFMKYCGTVGASREFTVFIDGDGAFYIDIKGLPDNKEQKEEIRKTIHSGTNKFSFIFD